MNAPVHSRKLRRREDGNGRKGLSYWCQGCKELHGINYEGGSAGSNWTWNGDMEKPVFGPSVLYQRDMWTPPVTPENIAQWREKPWPQTQVHHVCHTFVGCNGAQPGEVIFLGDCTHELAGTVQPFPDLPDYLQSPA